MLLHSFVSVCWVDEGGRSSVACWGWRSSRCYRFKRRQRPSLFSSLLGAPESPVLRTAIHEKRSVHFAGYGDAGLAEDVGDLRVAEARSVVFESEVILLFIYPEASQAVSVGEGAEAAELFVAQRRP